MFDKIIAYSIRNKFVIGLLVAALITWGLYSLRHLPIDAVPDITNNQVQVLTVSPTLATLEVERFITTPVELSLQNIQQLVEIRSISRFGLSVVTVVFEESMDIYLARQLVGEHLKEAAENIPEGLGTPKLAPISTGLGEIYQYALVAEPGYENQYPPTELRSIQDWIVRRQLSGIEGVVEVNTLGGHLKQYEVAVEPNQLKSAGIGMGDIFEALQNSNENTGGAYIEKQHSTYYIRTDGIAKSIADIENIVVDVRGGTPILVKDVASVGFGKAPRYGALTRNGKEAVGGTVMMLKGANSAEVTERVKERVTQVQKSLPEGVKIEPYLVRDKLVSTAIGTVKTNLLEGGLIVVFILVLLLGNWRAGLIVASVIPLAMLFAVSMMRLLGISANLMSLGAIDFGLIVDGAVIIVEAIVHRLQVGFAGQKLSARQMDGEVLAASQNIRSSAAFGEIIILMVYLPILALVGIEGKMFKPMAETVMLAIAGALILSLTYVPMMSALFLSKKITAKKTFSDRIIALCQRLYLPVLRFALKFKALLVLAAVALFAFSAYTFSRMGGEFIPTLEEGDFALHQILPPGSSLSQSIATSKLIHNKLLKEFPEVEQIVTKIGAAEVPTDPMPVETGDIMAIMKPKSEWTTASTRQAMFDKMEHSLKGFPGIQYEFSQPIQMRFNELMTGSRSDIAIKLYGDDLNLLHSKALEAEKIIAKIDGAGTVKVEQTTGMPQLSIGFKYDRMAQYGLHVKDVNRMVRAAFAGEKAGTIYEGDKRFDLVVRLDESQRAGIDNVEGLYISLPNGSQVPLGAVASVKMEDAPMQVSRDNTNRRIVIGVNVGDTDVETLVKKIQMELEKQVKLPPGYHFAYGGQFENLKAAQARLSIAVPVALALIFVLLYFTFGSFAQALLIFTAIPLSAIGGVWALQLRGMPFSISAGIGFIALFGVAVLNGIVLIGYFNQLKGEGVADIRRRILEGASVRLRPVLMTALVASLGFLPMALSTSGGAEVQRPLATVVIGGLVSATFLTLVILPILYSWLANWQERKNGTPPGTAAIALLPFLLSVAAHAQTPVSMQEAVNMALEKHPSVRAAQAQIGQAEALQNLPYQPGTTDLIYQGDGLFHKNGQRTNQIGLVQNFPNPAKVRARNALQGELAAAARISKEMNANELELRVKQLYLELQQRKELAKLYGQLAATYAEYGRIANLRVEVGEASRMESLNMQASLDEYRLLQSQVRMEIGQLERQLGQLLGAEQTVTTADSLQLLPFLPAGEPNSPQLRLVQQQAKVEQAGIGLVNTEAKPDFDVGYSLQKYFDGGWLHALQAGVKLPLFNKQTKQRSSAQKMKAEAAALQFEAEKFSAKQRLLSIEDAVNLYAAGAEHYERQLQSLLPEIGRVAELNYQAGEMSYLELLNTAKLLEKYRKALLEQVLAHNQSVVLHQFLSNQ